MINQCFEINRYGSVVSNSLYFHNIPQLRCFNQRKWLLWLYIRIYIHIENMIKTKRKSKPKQELTVSRCGEASNCNPRPGQSRTAIQCACVCIDGYIHLRCPSQNCRQLTGAGQRFKGNNRVDPIPSWFPKWRKLKGSYNLGHTHPFPKCPWVLGGLGDHMLWPLGGTILGADHHSFGVAAKYSARASEFSVEEQHINISNDWSNNRVRSTRVVGCFLQRLAQNHQNLGQKKMRYHRYHPHSPCPPLYSGHSLKHLQRRRYCTSARIIPNPPGIQPAQCSKSHSILLLVLGDYADSIYFIYEYVIIPKSNIYIYII